MRRRPVSIVAVLALLCVSVLATGESSLVAAPAASPPEVLQSNWELATGNRLTRDCGVSAPLPDRPDLSLWLFCDIEMREADGDPLPFPFRPGTYASVGPAVPGEVPDGLSEVPSPPTAADITASSDRAPAPFLPNPTGLTMPDGTPCGAAGSNTFATVRPRGIGQVPPGTAKMRLFDGSTEITLDHPSRLLFVVYADLCGKIVAGPTVEEHVKRVGVAVYDPAANRFVARLPVFDAGTGPADLPWYQNLWHPVIAGADGTTDGFARNVDLFLVASTCDTVGGFGTCAAGRVFLARTPLADDAGHSRLHDASAYRYWNPGLAGVAVDGPGGEDDAQTGWTTAAAAASILPTGTGLGPVHAYMGDFRWRGRQTEPAYAGRGKGLVMVEQYSVAGHHRIWQATTPTGPWTLKGSGATSCQTGATTVCGPMAGHPELSTLDQVLVSQPRVPEREVEVVAAAAPQVDHAPPGGWVTSNWERAGMQDIRRECGWSAPLPANPAGESVWVFCDMAPTFDAGADPHGLPYIGTFMGVAPTTRGQVPTALSDGPGARCVDPNPAVQCAGGSAPATLPARPNNNGPGFLLKNQPGLPGPGGQPCGADLDGDGDGNTAPITWAWGVTRGPAGPLTIDPSDGPPRTVPDGSQLLVLPYNEVCADVTAPPGTLGAIHPKRAGIAIYEPATNTVLAQTTIFGPPAPGSPAPSEPWAPGDLDWPLVLGHPVFQGGHLYLFSAECDTFVDPYDPAEQNQPCPSGKVMAARVPAGQIQDGTAYRWHTGAAGSDTWTSTNDPAPATSILPSTSPSRGPVGFGGTIYVGDYSALGKGLLLLEPTSWVGHYRIWQSASAVGPWRLVRGEGLMPGCGPDAFGQPRTPAACYNFGGHPELSPLDGPNAEHIYVSHIQPDISWSDDGTGRYDDDTNQYEVELVDIGTVPDL